MGGGDFGAAFSLDDSAITAWFGKNDFWSDAVYQGGDGWMFQHLAGGSLTVSAPGSGSGLSVSATQSFDPAVVNMSLGSAISINEGFIGARTRTMLLPLLVAGSFVNLTLAVPTRSPAKASFPGLTGGLPTWAGVTAGSNRSAVVRQSNYARFAPAVLGSAAPGAGLLTGTRFLRLLSSGKIEARTDGPFQQPPSRPGAQCLAPLPANEPLAPWTSNRSATPVVTMQCSAASGGNWSLPTAGMEGNSSAVSLMWTDSASGAEWCAAPDGHTISLGVCGPAAAVWTASSPPAAQPSTTGASPWLWLCSSVQDSGCFVSVPELADRDLALVMKVLRPKTGGGWEEVQPESRVVDAATASVSAVFASAVDAPAVAAEHTSPRDWSTTAQLVVVVQAATVRDAPAASPSQGFTPAASPSFPALDLADTELSAVSDPDAARASHDQWWAQWWAASALDLVEPGASCPPGAAPADAPPGCTLDGFLVGMDFLRAASSSPSAVLPSLWGPWCTADPSAWRDDVTIDYNIEANLFSAAALGRFELFQPYAAFAATLFNSSALRASSNWTLGGGPHSPARGLGTVDTAMTVSRASLGHPDPSSFPGLSAPNSAGPFSDQAFYTDWGNRWPAAMFAAPLIEWYWVTGDQSALLNTVFPWVSGVADFYAAYALPSPQNSEWLDIWPSCGQENCKQRTGGPSPPYELRVTADLGLAHLVLSQAIVLAPAAGEQNTTRTAAWSRLLNALPPFALSPGPNPVVASGVTPTGDTVPASGNYNTPLVNTMPVYPGRAVTRSSADRTMLDAFNRTAWELGSKAQWKPQNGLCSAWPAAARLCDNTFCGDSLMRAFETALTTVMFPNFWPSLGGGGLEQMGAVDAIVSMLVDTESPALRFFPAWNTSNYASLSRVRTVHGHAVNASTALQRIGVESFRGEPFAFFNPFSHSPAVLDETTGKAVPLSAGPSNGSLSFPTAAGHSYSIE